MIDDSIAFAPTTIAPMENLHIRPNIEPNPKPNTNPIILILTF